MRISSPLFVSILLVCSTPVAAQQQRGQSRRPRQVVHMDSARAEELYVSNRPEDEPQADFTRQVTEKLRTDSILAARAAGAYEFKKITYKSNADGMEVPAYLFTPLTKRGARGHAAMVWVHGG